MLPNPVSDKLTRALFTVTARRSKSQKEIWPLEQQNKCSISPRYLQLIECMYLVPYPQSSALKTRISVGQTGNLSGKHGALATMGKARSILAANEPLEPGKHYRPQQQEQYHLNSMRRMEQHQSAQIGMVTNSCPCRANRSKHKSSRRQ